MFAAADLQAALPEVAERYARTARRRPDFAFGSTGNLAAQIENGAPADLFFAADESFLERLAAAGLLEEGSRRVYAVGRLALVWRSSAPPPSSIADLAGPAYRAIALANPEHAPYGVAAAEALRAAGVWEVVEPRVISGENVAQALQFVSTGNADAGLVALGLVLGRDPLPHVLVPDTLHGPLRQAAAIVAGSRRRDEARRFLDFARGPEGREILRRYGFASPDP